MQTIIQIVAIPLLLVFCVLYYIFVSRASWRRKAEADKQLADSDHALNSTLSHENSDKTGEQD